MGYYLVTLSFKLYMCQDVKCISYCRLWSKDLKVTAWDSKMAKTEIPVWSWKHLLMVGRVDKLMLWWVTINIPKLKALKQKNLCNPRKPDLNRSNMSRQNSAFSLVFQLLLSLRNTTIWLGFWETFLWDSFSVFSVTWISFFSFHWLCKKIVTALLLLFLLHPSGPQTSMKSPSHHCLFGLLISTFRDHPFSSGMVSENTYQRDAGWKFAICPLLTYSFLTSNSVAYCLFNCN